MGEQLSGSINGQEGPDADRSEVVERPFQRRWPIPRGDDDWRSDQFVDGDRVLYAPEFRRLAGVTQVVPPQDDYLLHDRLTHSLKVAQVASSLARKLIYESVESGSIDELIVTKWVDPQVCYVAGLAHDIGHPPFGHAAESELQKVLETGATIGGVDKRRILADSFEGNAQSMRIVTKLSFRKDRKVLPYQEGLNLTWRAIGAIAKYPWTRGNHPVEVRKLQRKWNFYASEQQYLDGLEERGLVRTHRNGASAVTAVDRSPEAEIMDFSDDISYAVHDLEDFFKSGRIPLNRIQFIAESDPYGEEWTELFNYTFAKIQKLVPEISPVDPDTVKALLLTSVVPEMPSLPFDGSQRAHADLQRFGSSMINLLQGQCSLRYDEGRVSLKVTDIGRIAAEFLKGITQFYLIHDASLETLQAGQRRIVRELFLTFHALAVDAFLDHDGDLAAQRRLPIRLREYCRLAIREEVGLYNPEAALARSVVDFICCLTDRQALILHQRITGTNSASLSSRWLNH